MPATSPALAALYCVPSVDDMLCEAAAIAARGDAVALRAYINGLPMRDMIAVDMIAESDWEGVAFETWADSGDLSPVFLARVAIRKANDLAASKGPADVEGNPIVDVMYRNGATARAMPARSLRWAPDVGVEAWHYTDPAEAARAYPAPHRVFVDEGRAYLLPRD